MRFIPAILAVFAVAGCLSPQVKLETPFDPAEAAYAARSGSSKLTGQAFMRQMGGGVVTCAGEEVVLMPVTKYHTEVVTKTFGSPSGGKIGVLQTPQVEGTDSRAGQYTKKTVCDAQGNFSFTGLTPGDYYVMSRVLWYAPGNQVIPEGGTVAKRFTVRGGTTSVILS